MKRVYCDDWKEQRDEGVEICEPTWDQVKDLILGLNGDTKTLVTFGDDDMGWYMAIGGGADQYILYLSFDDEDQIFNLVEPTQKSDCFFELVVGGQRGKYPQNTCIGQEKVLMAAKTFFETQTPDNRLSWSE